MDIGEFEEVAAGDVGHVRAQLVAVDGGDLTAHEVDPDVGIIVTESGAPAELIRFVAGTKARVVSDLVGKAVDRQFAVRPRARRDESAQHDVAAARVDERGAAGFPGSRAVVREQAQPPVAGHDAATDRQDRPERDATERFANHVLVGPGAGQVDTVDRCVVLHVAAEDVRFERRVEEDRQRAGGEHRRHVEPQPNLRVEGWPAVELRALGVCDDVGPVFGARVGRPMGPDDDLRRAQCRTDVVRFCADRGRGERDQCRDHPK